jgi:hypothetical protein
MIEKVRPILWDSFSSMAFIGIGEKLGGSFAVGKELKKK